MSSRQPCQASQTVPAASVAATTWKSDPGASVTRTMSDHAARPVGRVERAADDLPVAVDRLGPGDVDRPPAVDRDGRPPDLPPRPGHLDRRLPRLGLGVVAPEQDLVAVLRRRQQAEVLGPDLAQRPRLLGPVGDVGQPDRPVRPLGDRREVVLGLRPGQADRGVPAGDGRLAVEERAGAAPGQVGELRLEAAPGRRHGHDRLLGRLERHPQHRDLRLLGRGRLDAEVAPLDLGVRAGPLDLDRHDPAGGDLDVPLPLGRPVVFEPEHDLQADPAGWHRDRQSGAGPLPRDQPRAGSASSSSCEGRVTTAIAAIARAAAAIAAAFRARERIIRDLPMRRRRRRGAPGPSRVAGDPDRRQSLGEDGFPITGNRVPLR